jgi:hypothetical protein
VPQFGVDLLTTLTELRAVAFDTPHISDGTCSAEPGYRCGGSFKSLNQSLEIA